MVCPKNQCLHVVVVCMVYQFRLEQNYTFPLDGGIISFIKPLREFNILRQNIVAFVQTLSHFVLLSLNTDFFMMGSEKSTKCVGNLSKP